MLERFIKFYSNSSLKVDSLDVDVVVDALSTLQTYIFRKYIQNIYASFLNQIYWIGHVLYTNKRFFLYKTISIDKK